jgi:hypothetical protein
MNLIEFLGFVIVMIAMGVIMAKRAYEDHQRRKHPEKFAEEKKAKEEAMKEFLRSLNIEVESEEEAVAVVESKPAPPKRSVNDAFTFHRDLEDRAPTSEVAEREFEVGLDTRFELPKARIASPSLQISRTKDAYLLAKHPSLSARLVQGNLRDAIILRDILGPPKGL